MQSPCLLALSSNYDYLLITETWLNDNVPDDAFAIPGYQSFRRSRTPQSVGGCLVYICNSVPTSLCQGTQLTRVPAVLWLRADNGSGDLQMECIYRPPGSCRTEFLLLNDAINCFFTLPGPRFVKAYFITQGSCRSTFNVLNSLLSFVIHMQRGG